ncbi:hypothetical protein P692DRAFT_201615811 [Suillus brevipes Sb2]|nr:hypothetical protein P692DRAFT_201615811 [Suillus brevipes Sb2]
MEPCDSLSAVLKLMFNLQRDSIEVWLTLQEQTPPHCSEDITTSRSSYSSESCLLLSALTISATRACILTHFSSLSRLNVIHGHIPISHFILHHSLPFIRPMIPGI